MGFRHPSPPTIERGLDTTDGFLRDGSNLTVLDDLLQDQYPNASFEPKAINADGYVAGYAYGPAQAVHAFVRASA